METTFGTGNFFPLLGTFLFTFLCNDRGVTKIFDFPFFLAENLLFFFLRFSRLLHTSDTEPNQANGFFFFSSPPQLQALAEQATSVVVVVSELFFSSTKLVNHTQTFGKVQKIGRKNFHHTRAS